MARDTFAEALDSLIHDQVESVIGDFDFSDAVEVGIENSSSIENQVEKAVESAIDDLDIDDKVKDAVDNYDMSESIETVLRDNYDFEDMAKSAVDELVEDAVAMVMEDVYKSAKFIDMVNAVVTLRLQNDAAAKRAKLVDYVKCGPLVRFIKGKWVAIKGW